MTRMPNTNEHDSTGLVSTGSDLELLVCNAEGVPHPAHIWDFGSGESFRCEGSPDACLDNDTDATDDATKVNIVRGLLAAYGEAEGTPGDYEFLVYQIGEAVR